MVEGRRWRRVYFSTGTRTSTSEEARPTGEEARGEEKTTTGEEKRMWRCEEEAYRAP